VAVRARCIGIAVGIGPIAVAIRSVSIDRCRRVITVLMLTMVLRRENGNCAERKKPQSNRGGRVVIAVVTIWLRISISISISIAIAVAAIFRSMAVPLGKGA